jgi:polysaccharide export outer membrane protein
MGIMKQMKVQLFVFMAIVLLTSCASSKKVAYLDNSSSVELSEIGHNYKARIMPHDELTIVVNTITPSAAAPFNKTIPTTQSSNNMTLTSTQSLQTYLVDDDGNINFPIIGTVKLAGLTKTESEQFLLDKIRPYLEETENPMVTVRMSGFSYSVIGEVLQPGRFTITNEKVNVFEALASAGDMTIYGVRDRVKLIREDMNGKKTIYTLNLNDARIVDSPYYYLQQNDIVYVEPNKAKAQNSEIGSMTTLWFSATSILVSIATLVISLVK